MTTPLEKAAEAYREQTRLYPIVPAKHPEGLKAAIAAYLAACAENATALDRVMKAKGLDIPDGAVVFMEPTPLQRARAAILALDPSGVG